MTQIPNLCSRYYKKRNVIASGNVKDYRRFWHISKIPYNYKISTVL